MRNICIVLFACLTFSIYASDAKLRSGVLYKARHGKLKEAICQYRLLREKNGCDDLELIQQVATLMIDQGFRSSDSKEVLLAVFGAGMARNCDFLYIFESGLENQNPQIQLASLYFLNELRDDRADLILKKAMLSPYLIIRLEAAKMLALKKEHSALCQIEGLMCKVPSELLPLFPPLFSLCNDAYSTSVLKKFFTDKNPKVRLATILSCIDFGRDDLLPQIRTLATHGNIEEQEAAVSALGYLKDTSSIQFLQTIVKTKSGTLKLAAYHSLYQLGNIEVVSEIEKLGSCGDLYAITLLGKIPGSEDLLYKLLQSNTISIRFNAALALLELRDPRCTKVLLEILLKDARDIVVVEQPSPGILLTSWRVVFCSSSKIDSEGSEGEICQSIKESILAKTQDLPEEHFFKFAKEYLESNETELVPSLIHLIETRKTRAAVEFLETELQRIGAPLVRAYCNLALFELGESGPYAEYVRRWIYDLKHVDIIGFRPLMPKARGQSCYSITPQETCRLFVEALQSLANQKDPQAIEALLTAISLGNPKNRFALAGLLIRATE